MGEIKAEGFSREGPQPRVGERHRWRISGGVVSPRGAPRGGAALAPPARGPLQDRPLAAHHPGSSTVEPIPVPEVHAEEMILKVACT